MRAGRRRWGNVAAGLVLAAAVAAPAETAAKPRAQAAEALEDARALFAPDGTAAAAGGSETREGSRVLRRLALELPRLSPRQRRAARPHLGRPTDPRSQLYFGAEALGSPVCSGRICVHWSRNAEHAPAARDLSPLNGVPDFVDAVAAAADASYEVENVALGWRPAKPDGRLGRGGGRGAAGELDIYIRELGLGLFGLAVPDPGQRGASRHAFLVLDNDFRGYAGPPLALMRATLAHEYNHALQYAIDSFQDDWMFEATATWMEEKVFPAVNDYLNFLPRFARRPGTPLFEPRGRLAKGYGSAVWNHWLDSRLGADVIRTAWELSPRTDPPHRSAPAYRGAIATAGGSLSGELQEFAAATAEWRGDARFPDSARYPEIRRNGRLSGRRAASLRASAYRLWRVRPRGRELVLRGRQRRPSARTGIALVARRGPVGSGDVTVVSRDLSGRRRASLRLQRPRSYRRITAVAVNSDLRSGRRGLRHDPARLSLRLNSRR
jgi:hypothetical protein